jgi:hypothetical protein
VPFSRHSLVQGQEIAHRNNLAGGVKLEAEEVAPVTGHQKIRNPASAIASR